MNPTMSFNGFPKQTVSFLNDLKKNNTKEWFNHHRQEYEDHLMAPARAFVEAMGERLKTISPGIISVPKVNKSLFRINRDTRFSPDKSPYKTNLGILFWEGKGPRMECSGYYFHLEPPNLMLGLGLYMFSKDFMERYRQAVVAPESGSELTSIVKGIERIEGFSLGGKHYKRIPFGFDADHPNAELLLHNGLYAGGETEIPKELYSKDLLDFCIEKYRPLSALHDWLVVLTEKT